MPRYTSHFEISNGFADDFSSFMQLLPGPRPRLTGQTQPQTTRPLRSTPITGASPLLRAGPPARPATVLNFPPGYSRLREPPHATCFAAQCRDAPSHVSCKSRRPGSCRLHAGHRLASNRAPTRPCHASTRLRFRCHSSANDTSTAFGARLPGPHLTPPTMPFPHRSPRRSSANAACGGLKPPPDRRLRRATLHLLQNTASRSSPITLPSAFVAHVDPG